MLCSEVADLIVQSSVFGWIVSDCLSSGGSASDHNVSHQLLCVNVGDDIVRSLGELESVGIVSEGLESVVDPVLQEFENYVDLVDGRYEEWFKYQIYLVSTTRRFVRYMRYILEAACDDDDDDNDDDDYDDDDDV